MRALLPDRDALEQLRTDLRSDDAATRSAAIERLGGIVGAGTREVIAEALASDNPEVREAAERLLQRLADVIGEA